LELELNVLPIIDLCKSYKKLTQMMPTNFISTLKTPFGAAE